MTRDEAIDIFREKLFSGRDSVHANHVDAFVALGMLKLDEPKSAEQKFYDCLYATSWGERSCENLLRLIDRAGLKIVEK